MSACRWSILIVGAIAGIATMVGLFVPIEVSATPQLSNGAGAYALVSGMVTQVSFSTSVEAFSFSPRVSLEWSRKTKLFESSELGHPISVRLYLFTGVAVLRKSNRILVSVPQLAFAIPAVVLMCKRWRRPKRAVGFPVSTRESE